MTPIARGDPNRDRCEILVDGQVTGSSARRRHAERLTILHTGVDDHHAVRRLGTQLVAGLLADSERRALDAVPWRPYMRSVVSHDAARDSHLVPDVVRSPRGSAHLRG